MTGGEIVVCAIIGVLFLPWFAAVAAEIHTPTGEETRLGVIGFTLVAILLGGGWYPVALALGWL